MESWVGGVLRGQHLCCGFHGEAEEAGVGVASMKDFRGPWNLGLCLVVCYLALDDLGGNVMA